MEEGIIQPDITGEEMWTLVLLLLQLPGRFLSLRGCHPLVMSTGWEGCELKLGLNGLSVMREYTGLCLHREHTGLTLSQKGFADWNDHSSNLTASPSILTSL